MSQKNKSDLRSEVTAQIITNNNNLVTAAQLQGILIDYLDSLPNWISDSGRIGLHRYLSTILYQSGDCAIGPNGEILAAIRQTSGTFDPASWFPVTNLVSKRSIIVDPVLVSNTAAPILIIEYDDTNFSGLPLQTEISLQGIMNCTDSGILTLSVMINGVPHFTLTSPTGVLTNEVIEFRAMLTQASRASGGGILQFIGAGTLECKDWKLKAHCTGPVNTPAGTPF